MPTVPTRSTSEYELNQFNDQLRRSPAYQQFLESIGQGHGRPTSLSRGQQGQLEAFLKAQGTPVPGGMHIDQAGNLNQKNRLVRNTAIAAGLAAGGYFAAPAIAGALGGGAAGGAGAAGAAGAAGSAAIPAAIAGIPAGVSIGGATALGGLGAAGLGASAIPAAVAGIPAGTSIGGATTLGSTAGGTGMLSSFSKYAKAAQDISSVLGKQEEGKTQGKITQAELQQRQDQNALANYIAQQNAQNTAANTDLNRKQFESQNRSGTAKQALIGALLGGGVSPTSISGGKATGGLFQALQSNPSALEAMQRLGSQGSTAQISPQPFQGGQMLQAPQVAPLQQVDDGGFLSTLARIGQLAGAAGQYGTDKPRAQYGPNGQYLGG
jgi:hypothetical protein